MLCLLATFCVSPIYGQWKKTSFSTSTEPNFLTSIVAIGDTIIVSADGDGITRSSDQGATWTVINSGLTTNRMKMLAQHGSRIYVGGMVATGGVYWSSDYGYSWNITTDGLAEKGLYCLRSQNGKLYAGSIKGIYVLNEATMIWSRVNTENFTISTADIIAFDDKIIAAQQELLISQDNGATWNPIESGLPSGYSRFLCRYDTTVIAYKLGIGFYRTNDLGKSWQECNTGITDTNIFSVCTFGKNIFAGTYGGNVYLSTNGGDFWTDITDGLADSSISAIGISATHIYIGTRAKHIYKHPLSQLTLATSVRQIDEKQSQYLLMQSYPNPVVSNTSIRFFLPQAEHVSLVLHDETGKVVRTLVSELLGPGTYETTYDLTSLASGAYYYTITAGAFIKTGMLLKK
jgi:hypothetical protein